MTEETLNRVPKELWIDNQPVPAKQGARFTVENPATTQTLMEVADAGIEDAAVAIASVQRAQQTLQSMTGRERSALLQRWFELIIREQEALARIMTLENGKPLAESAAEIRYAASFVQWFAEEAPRVYGRIVPALSPEKRTLVLRQPVGPVAAVTPWNFPAAMVTRKVAPALAAGCPCILKPAEQTPLTALFLAKLLTQADAPPGALNVLTTSHPAPLVERLLGDSAIRKLSFTGSTEVGQLLMRQAAQHMTRLSLELGGQAPFLVFEDADLNLVLESLMYSKFRNSGQTCIASNRFLVHESCIGELAARVKERVSTMVVGNGLDSGVSIGPLIDQAGREKVQRHIKDAIEHGAKILLGGEPQTGPGYFMNPAVLSDVPREALMMREETFGPVIPLTPFRTEEEAVATANHTPFGLAAYFFTRDNARAWRVAEALQFGIVGLNDGAPSAAQAPFGGVKLSGLGREGGLEGIDAFLETKYLSWGGLSPLT